jgi:hypothetical protein
LRHKDQSIAKTFRKRAYTEAEERLLIRYVRLYPKNIYTQIKHAYRLSCEKATIRKILAEYYIINWKYAKCLFLIDINATKRLA